MRKTITYEELVKHSDSTSSVLTVPVGLSNDQAVNLEFIDNVAILGGIGSGKSYILENILSGYTLLNKSDSLNISLLDCKGMLDTTSMTYWHVDVVKNNLSDIKGYLESLLSTIMAQQGTMLPTTQLVVIDEISLLMDDSHITEVLHQVMSHGFKVGVHVIIVGQLCGNMSSLLNQCSEKVFTYCAKGAYVSNNITAPYVKLPIRHGMATLIKENEPNALEVIIIPPKNQNTACL